MQLIKILPAFLLLSAAYAQYDPTKPVKPQPLGAVGSEKQPLVGGTKAEIKPIIPPPNTGGRTAPPQGGTGFVPFEGSKMRAAPLGDSGGALLSSKDASGDMAQCLQNTLDRIPVGMDVTICYSGRSSLEPHTVEMVKISPWYQYAQGSTCNGARVDCFHMGVNNRFVMFSGGDPSHAAVRFESAKTCRFDRAAGGLYQIIQCGQLLPPSS